MSDKVRKGVKKSFFTSYNMIFESNLSIFAKIVYLYMCRCADSQAQSFPSHADISIKCSCGISSVKKAIAELIDVKLVVKENRFRKTKNGKMAQTSNLYIVYDRPFDTIPPEELEDVKDDNPSCSITTLIPSHNMATPSSCNNSNASCEITTPMSSHNYKGITQLCTTQKEGIPINQPTQDKEGLMEDIDLILSTCDIKIYSPKIQVIINNALNDMYITDNFSKANNISLETIRLTLKRLKNNQIDSAINNYQDAFVRAKENGNKISAPMKYFEKCLWNSITDDELYSGIFEDMFEDNKKGV